MTFLLSSSFGRVFRLGGPRLEIERALRADFLTHPQKRVKDGVEAAVKVRESLRHEDPLLQTLLRARSCEESPPASSACPAGSLRNTATSRRRSTRSEPRCLERLALLRALGAARQLGDDDAVADENHEPG